MSGSDPILAELARASAAFGANIDFVQGAGGNTSAKCGDVLWIKASGFLLADAGHSNVFVPVDRYKVHAAITARNEVAVRACVRSDLTRSTRWPSIETTMHEVLPHKVVFHGHGIETLARVVLENPDLNLIASRLAGLSWTLVPYATPGLPLTELMRSRPPSDVYLLANHGLVVGADAPDAAFALYRDVEMRLSHGTEAPAAVLEAKPAIPDGLVWVHSAWCDAFARRSDLVDALLAQTLYPDHVVFLGPGLPVASKVETIADSLRFDWCVVRGYGIVCRSARINVIAPMAEAVARVALRLPVNPICKSLSDTECAHLLNWDLERYRQSLSK